MRVRYGPKCIQKESKYVKNAKMSKNDPHPFLDPPKMTHVQNLPYSSKMSYFRHI
jgi:hypothetical protein